MEDTVVRADGPVPPVLPGSLDIDPYPCDPSQLKEMIVQANLPEDFRASFLASSTSQNADIASAVASDLEAAGLRIDMQMRDWSAFKEAVNSGEADMFFLSWWADIPDGIDFLFPTFHSANAGAGGNRSFFSSPAVDAMIETAMKTADAAERAKLYAGISQAVVRECPWIFLWHKKSYYAVSKRMRGFRVFPMYMIDKGEWYSLKAGK
jgi:ABC-type transport system substrate-binding protein